MDNTCKSSHAVLQTKEGTNHPVKEKKIVTGNYYDKHATNNPIERFLVNGFHKALTQLITLTHPKRVLEIGCGEGHIIGIVKKIFPGCHYTAVDVDAALLHQAKEKGADEICMSTADPISLPYADNTYDLILMIEVLEHLEHPSEALSEVKRLCAKHVIASVPNEPLWRFLNMARFKYLNRLGNTPGHVNHWGAKGFEKLITSQFDAIRIMFPVPWVMILAQKTPCFSKI